MQTRLFFRSAYVLALCLAVSASVGIVLLLHTKNSVYQTALTHSTPEAVATPFPVGVDPAAKIITDILAVDEFYEDTLAFGLTDNWHTRLSAVLSRQDWYQQLASPVSRIVVIWPGERKEEIAAHIGDVLHWNNVERDRFLTAVTTGPLSPALPEGTFYPKQYITHRYATPEEVATTIKAAFADNILTYYTPEVATTVPLSDALIIASLLEREASDFTNMREVSGVIWNRIFRDMPLQLDATLQYAKAPQGGWWPVVRPDDKYIDSTFNTYQNDGLPPTPIANPSAAAVLAALNPLPTSCLYYFHAEDSSYHCSPTYKEHVAKLKMRYGRGR